VDTLSSLEVAECIAFLDPFEDTQNLRILKQAGGVCMPGLLTTHVLDTMRGCPAADMEIRLWRLDKAGQKGTLLKSMRTNASGRTDMPLLEAASLTAGVYELVFAVGAYFAARGEQTATPPFLDIVPVRFGIADPEAHYHVPLLVSPWAYSTYRGS
jgi:hydroxyisourate hydrolase